MCECRNGVNFLCRFCYRASHCEIITIKCKKYIVRLQKYCGIIANMWLHITIRRIKSMMKLGRMPFHIYQALLTQVFLNTNASTRNFWKLVSRTLNSNYCSRIMLVALYSPLTLNLSDICLDHLTFTFVLFPPFVLYCSKHRFCTYFFT